jgi:hypothetical protein
VREVAFRENNLATVTGEAERRNMDACLRLFERVLEIEHGPILTFLRGGRRQAWHLRLGSFY